MTVVIDCNIFVRCLSSYSPYHSIYKSLISSKFTLAVTSDILLEYEEIVQLKYNTTTSSSLISLLLELPNVVLIHPHYKWNLIQMDQDDNKYCDCAIASQSSFIVTEDRHFDVLRGIPFPSLNVVSIDEFIKLIQ